MLYSRLKLARNLLSDDGVIFISIDDNEASNAKKIGEEIFGDANFIAQVVWEGANKNDARQIGVSHEYALVFAKNRQSVRRDWSIKKEGVEDVIKEVKRLKQEHGDDFKAASVDLAGYFRAMKNKPVFGLRRFRYIDSRGVYKEDDPTAPGGRRFELINPETGSVIPLRKNRGWSFDQATFNDLVREGRISFISETSVMVRRYLHETDKVTPPSVFYQPARSASERLGKLIGPGIFDFPKDETVIKSFIEMATDNAETDDIILDFFAGSSTTAHAVMQLNAEDGGNRRFIMVQLPEACDEKSEAFKAGYKTIAEISKERIRRAGKKIKEDNATTAANLDTGFRVLKVDTSNAKDIYYTPDQIKQDELALHVDHIKEDRTAEDLLFQVMLDWGVDLSLPITKTFFVSDNNKSNSEGRGVNGEKPEWHTFTTDAELEAFQSSPLTTHSSVHEVFFVDGNAIAACFETGINEDFVKELAKRKPLRAVFRDASYESDALKINIGEIFKLLSPGTELKTI